MNKKRNLKLPLFLLLAPITLIIGTIALYATVNFALAVAANSDISLGSAPDILRKIVNVILFLVGAVSTLALLPCAIAGLILLVIPQNPPTTPTDRS